MLKNEEKNENAAFVSFCGDIDLTAFTRQVRDMLENEEKNENVEFRVKKVEYIQAEVKIIKCLVENIVVDISFNQLGGLFTLCFLEKACSAIYAVLPAGQDNQGQPFLSKHFNVIDSLRINNNLGHNVSKDIQIELCYAVCHQVKCHLNTFAFLRSKFYQARNTSWQLLYSCVS
uniref:PAP/OAS1 substrate-binding-related domain-containing protein n=1 Tax=Populus trichocarpa TaxID=3694 RepID=A0A2K2BML7_POPTR